MTGYEVLPINRWGASAFVDVRNGALKKINLGSMRDRGGEIQIQRRQHALSLNVLCPHRVSALESLKWPNRLGRPDAED
jgi:hypothetical protein